MRCCQAGLQARFRHTPLADPSSGLPKASDALAMSAYDPKRTWAGGIRLTETMELAVRGWIAYPNVMPANFITLAQACRLTGFVQVNDAWDTLCHATAALGVIV